MKDFILLIVVIILLAPIGHSATLTGEQYDFPLAEGMVAMQSANTDFSTVKLPGDVTPLPLCRCGGTGKEKSGDGLISMPCVCQPNCKCKKPNDQGQAPPVKEEIKEQYVRYYFGAKWCGPCVTFKTTDIPMLQKAGWTFSDKETSDVTVVDVDENPTLFQKYAESNPQSIPYFVVAKGGKRIKARTGYVNYMDYSNWSNKIINEDKAK